MSSRQKARRIALPVLLVLLLVSLKYILQPVDLYTLFPDLEVDTINVTLITADTGVDSRDLHLEAGTEEFDQLLSRLEDLRFTRSAMNPVIQAMPFLAKLDEGGSKNVEDGEITNMFLHLSQKNDDGTWRQCELDLWVDEWSYREDDHDVNLPLSMKDGKAVGQDLARELWELAGAAEEATP